MTHLIAMSQARGLGFLLVLRARTAQAGQGRSWRWEGRGCSGAGGRSAVAEGWARRSRPEAGAGGRGWRRGTGLSGGLGLIAGDGAPNRRSRPLAGQRGWRKEGRGCSGGLGLSAATPTLPSPAPGQRPGSVGAKLPSPVIQADSSHGQSDAGPHSEPIYRSKERRRTSVRAISGSSPGCTFPSPFISQRPRKSSTSASTPERWK
ncbi:MAG: hypothetical protein ACI9HE_000715 [Planctomycetota bacterium]|jgi:hypothetical protein